MNRFPEEFDAQKKDFPVVIVLLDQVDNLREESFEDFVEELFLFRLNCKLESSGYCDKTLQARRNIFLFCEV